MSEAYHPVSFINKVFKKQDYLDNNSQFKSMNSIFYAKQNMIPYTEPISYKKVYNRNVIDSIFQGEANKYEKEDFLTQNMRIYNQKNFTIPRPLFTTEELQRRNFKIVFGTDENIKERSSTEKQEQYRAYQKDEVKKKNDTSIFKSMSDPNLRKHHHDFDAYGINRKNKNISNYNLNYQSNPNETRLLNPFANQEKLKTIEKMKQDNVKFGSFHNEPNSLMSEAMSAFNKKEGEKQVENVEYKKLLQQRLQPLVFGVEQNNYETSSQAFLTPQLTKDSIPAYVTKEEIEQRKQSNFTIGVDNKFDDFKKNNEATSKQQEYMDAYKYNREIYRKLLNQNKWDNTVLGECKNVYQSISKAELPHHPANKYLESKQSISNLSQKLEQLKSKDILGSDFNKDIYKTEVQDKYKQYENVKKNNLDPLREQMLRQSSLKFDDLKNPDFLSINKSTFLSPNLYKIEKSQLQQNLENSIKKVESQDYIFGDKKQKWITTNQQLLIPHEKSVPNSLGNKLIDLKMSHFQLR